MKNNYRYLEGENLSKHIKVGQSVYIIPVGNLMRYKEGSPMDHAIEHKVSKVGRKYFYIENNLHIKYGFNHYAITDITNYAADYEVYLSKEDLEKGKELEKLKYVGDKVNSLFDKMNIEDKRILAELIKKYN